MTTKPLSIVSVGAHLDITDVFERKCELIRLHKSQTWRNHKCKSSKCDRFR